MSKQQTDLYREAGEQFAPAIARLSNAMESDREKARDLEQDIHLEIWRSLERFEGDCSLKTWVFRIAHNVAADHVGRAKRQINTVDIDEIVEATSVESTEHKLTQSHALARLQTIIRSLPLLDAQVILLWLEGHSAAEIAEVTGLSSGAVATRISRLKDKLATHFTPLEKNNDK